MIAGKVFYSLQHQLNEMCTLTVAYMTVGLRGFNTTDNISICDWPDHTHSHILVNHYRSQTTIEDLNYQMITIYTLVHITTLVHMMICHVMVVEWACTTLNSLNPTTTCARSV